MLADKRKCLEAKICKYLFPKSHLELLPTFSSIALSLKMLCIHSYTC